MLVWMATYVAYRLDSLMAIHVDAMRAGEMEH
jgi:hypothetical protein